VVAAAGVPGIVTAAMVKPGAAVLDVGVSRVDGKVAGDVAKDVAEGAREGDEVATGIWREAGAHIAGVVVAAATRSGLDGEVPWVLLGRLGAADDLLRPGWEPVLRAGLPGAALVAPDGMPLDGVTRLLGVDTAPFGAMVRAVEL